MAGREREVQPLRSIEKDDSFHGPFHTPGSRLFEVKIFLCHPCVYTCSLYPVLVH
jgi:hypothetical protein